MKMAGVIENLAGSGRDKWETHFKGRALKMAGHDIIELTIGEPDVAMSDDLAQAAIDAIRNGRNSYTDGQGEPELRKALSDYYSHQSGQVFGPENLICFPGTQTALYAVMMGLAEAGDEVIVGDPMYATYEGVIKSCGAQMVPVALKAEHGFRMQADDIEACLTENTRVILLTNPHNPTGAILEALDMQAIGALAVKHDLWIVSDEVYAELVFEGEQFQTFLSYPEFRDRVVIVSSISKSHAAPGFRSGWCVGSADFTSQLLPLAEAMLFGNQPFIADMTAKAIRDGSKVAAGMRERFAARATRLKLSLETNDLPLQVSTPKAGMFALINVKNTGMTGLEFANALLENKLVCVMPGQSFGDGVTDWIRVALTVSDDEFDEAIHRLVEFCDEMINKAKIA